MALLRRERSRNLYEDDLYLMCNIALYLGKVVSTPFALRGKSGTFLRRAPPKG